MKNSKLFIALLSVVLIPACESEPSETLQASIVQSTAISNFDPANSVIPFPNDLLFAGTADGTLNIPVVDANDFSDPAVAMNALDGFSTIAPFTTGFTGPILASSIDGNSVKVYQVNLSASGLPNNQGGAVIAINTTLVFGVDYVATVSSVDSSGTTLAVVPLKPLDPASSYYVVITDSLKSTDGNPMGLSGAYGFTKGIFPLETGGMSNFPALTDAEAVALEPLRQLVNTSESTLFATPGVTLTFSDVIMSWSFTTQSIGNVLTTVRAVVGTPTTSLVASAVDLGAGVGKSLLGAANVFVGTLISVPYYLTAPAIDPTVILNNPWQAATAVAGENNLTGANPLPASTVSATIPLMITTPVDTITFPSPWKTVIYQHGITRQRSDILAVADALAAAGFATVAIDMPLHGLDSTSPFYQSGLERTFDIDLVGQDANGSVISVGPDTVTDSSGVHFINLSNLLVSRDNLRQAAADLFALTAAIPGIDIDGGGADLNSAEIYFVGHSLGAIVGTTFTSLETGVKDVVLANGGGGIPKILDGSASISPAIVAGLAAVGVNKGTADYESFLGAAQTVIDAGDPVNYATTLTAKGDGILYFEVVGGNSSPSDLVVPNTVPDGNDSSGTVPAPLAGTEPMLRLLGLTHRNATFVGPNLLAATKFTAGSHGSFIDPSDDLAVTTEMQTEMATFLATDGGTLLVSDPSVLLAP